MSKPNYEQEIIDLHDFFTAWFTGTLPKTNESYQPFTNALAEGFKLISPDASIAERDRLLEQLFEAHGVRKNFSIWIKNVQLCYQNEHNLLATYEEWQSYKGETTSRLSSVLFAKKESAPHKLEWLHVHETWLQNA